MLDGWFVLHGFVHLILHLIWCLKTYYFNWSSLWAAELQGVVKSYLYLSLGKQAVVGLENLGKGWLGIQRDGGKGRPRGKMENVTDSQFEMKFIWQDQPASAGNVKSFI